jgi:HAD superfamily hydrolase (TIGR01509 family)
LRNRLAWLGVIWDMDGVLADTAAVHYAAWVKTLSAQGVDLRREDFDRLFGVDNVATLRAILGEGIDSRQIEEISREKEKTFRDQIRGQVKTFPGVREWLDRLRSEGARTAIGSSGPPENIAALLSELAIQDRFDAVLSGAGLPSKPDPTLFLMAARSIGLAPQSCVVVEDSPAGVEAAERAGMKCIAVTNTHGSAALARASLVVRGLDELPPRTFEELVSRN